MNTSDALRIFEAAHRDGVATLIVAAQEAAIEALREKLERETPAMVPTVSKVGVTVAIERLKSAASSYGIDGESDSSIKARRAFEKMKSAELVLNLAIAKAIRDAEQVGIQRCASECDDEASFEGMKGGNAQSGAERCARRCRSLLPRTED